MKMSKFERRKQEMQKKFEEEMKAIEEAERKEIERRIEPVIAKIGKLAEEEARRALESDPAILEVYSFRKREAAREMKDALERIFNAQLEDDSSGEAEGETESGKMHENAEAQQPDAQEQKPGENGDPFDKDFAGQGSDESGGMSQEEASGGEKSDAQKKGFRPFGRS